MLDTQENLSLITGRQLPELTQLAMQFAGTIALRLVHDHLLQMDLNKYNGVIREQVLDINTKVSNLKKVSLNNRASYEVVQHPPCYLIGCHNSLFVCARALSDQAQAFFGSPFCQVADHSHGILPPRHG